MSGIITKSMVMQAIHLARLSAVGILQTEEAVWGPRVVYGVVEAPGITKRIPFDFHVEEYGKAWDPAWGSSRDFMIIAGKKLDVVMREQEDTSVIAKLTPWLLNEGEFMYAGGVYRDGIGVAVSGAKGWADEAIARVIADILIMLAQFDAERRVQDKFMKITS